MSSKAKKISKKLAETLTFPLNMYSNIFGSYIIASFVLNGKGNVRTILKEWKRLEKKGDVYMEDEDWLKTLCARFGVEYDVSGRIALVAGHHNILCLIVDEDGTIWPLREDGVYPAHSLAEALEDQTIYRITDGVSLSTIDDAKIGGQLDENNR